MKRKTKGKCVRVSTPVPRESNLSIYRSFPYFLTHLNTAQSQGDMACVQGPCPTKLPDAREVRADHSHVPANC